MAEKAEKIEKFITIQQRIEQFITIQQRTITTRDYETNDEIISKFYPRKEAIERMAKAICNMGDEETWGRVDDNYKHYCTAQAEWALNALLEKGD